MVMMMRVVVVGHYEVVVYAVFLVIELMMRVLKKVNAEVEMEIEMLKIKVVV